MVAITRTAAAGIAILSALNGAAASTETRDVFDDIAALDARDVLNEGAEPLALDARDFEDELETRDFDDDLEKRFLFGKIARIGAKVAGKAIGAIRGRKGRRSLDDGEDSYLEARDFDDLDAFLETRDFDDYDSFLEARDEEESAAEGGPSDDAPVSKPHKGKKGLKKGKLGKGLKKGKLGKGLKKSGLRKSKFGKKAHKKFGKKGPKSGKKAHKKARKSKEGTRSVDGGEFYEA